MTQPTDTNAVIERFNRAFLEHNADLLTDLVSDDCVMESVEPAPDGTRYQGRESCLAFWRALATDTGGSFEPEDVAVLGDRAIILWRYHFGDDGASVRGVNIMRVSGGRIVEALGYVKSGEAAIGEALSSAIGH